MSTVALFHASSATTTRGAAGNKPNTYPAILDLGLDLTLGGAVTEETPYKKSRTRGGICCCFRNYRHRIRVYHRDEQRAWGDTCTEGRSVKSRRSC